MSENLVSQEFKENSLGLTRAEFDLPKDLIYFDGNSLGPLLHKTKEHLADVINNQWGAKLIGGWNANWYQLSEKLGDQLGTILGAATGEVILGDSTSINLYKLASALIHKQPGKGVLIDSTNFPTDMYLLQGIQTYSGHSFDLREVDTSNYEVAEQSIKAELKQGDVGLLVLSHVAFKSGYRYNLARINELAENYGAEVLWDLSHSAGAVNLNLADSNTKFAVGCTYKYLNGGPGSPAFLYVRSDQQNSITSPIWGWFGHKAPFEFEHEFTPQQSIRKFLVGTPPILSLTALQPSLDLFSRISMHGVAQKSKLLSNYFIDLVEEKLSVYEYGVASPKDPTKRGSHVVITHKNAWQICQALIAKHVGGVSIVPDFRKPNFIRFGFAPLYNTFEEIEIAIEQLKLIVRDDLFEKFPATHTEVT